MSDKMRRVISAFLNIIKMINSNKLFCEKN